LSSFRAPTPPSLTQPLPLHPLAQAAARDFQAAHGLAVRAVGLRVEDATAAYEARSGGRGTLHHTPPDSMPRTPLPPRRLR